MATLDLVIVGGGPAGLGAGIQAHHMGLKVKILESDAWGGRLRLARRVENFPGLTEPMSGQEVVDRLVVQARMKGVPMSRDACRFVDYRDCFQVAAVWRSYAAKTVVIAAGVRPRLIDFPGYHRVQNRLFYSWQALPRIQGRRVAIIGGGEAAFDQACSLAERGAEATILIRGSKPKAFPGLVRDAELLGIRILYHAEVKRAELKDERLLVELGAGDKTQCSFDYLLVAVGSQPTHIPVSPSAATRENQGLYHAGDICSGSYRQAAIAFGDGIKKAMMIHDALREMDQNHPARDK